MIVPPVIKRKYNQSNTYVETIGNKIKERLYKYCEKQGYAFLWRIKDLESLTEKIETGRYSKWSEIDDLFACSIIIPTLKHESGVLEFLKKEYPPEAITLRNTKKKAPDVFRFDSTRYISKMEFPDSSFQLFEIQIRTVFEHAWITTTHDLVYKNKIIDWKRLRLAAEIKANIELLDNIILSFEENTSTHLDNYWPEIEVKVSLQNFISNCFDNALLPVEYSPHDSSRMVDNLYNIIKYIPSFNEMKGKNDLSELFNFFESKFNSYNQSNTFPMSISFHQFILGLLIQESKIKKMRSFTPTITPELIFHFPRTKMVTNIFDVNS